MFTKELFLTQISTLNDFGTLQYLGIHVYLISFLLIFFIPLLLNIIIKAIGGKGSYWYALLISGVIEAILITLTILGILPSLTSI